MSIRTLLSLGLETSAVVAMADDGGSTGILREEADATTPGDVRKCIAAFARDPNDPLTRAFKYRFSFARNHTLGNLMLAALEDAAGIVPRGHSHLRTSARRPGARVPLHARPRDACGAHARRPRAGRPGQRLPVRARRSSACGSSARPSPRAYRACARSAIRQADLIVLGPGSLFTSIIPNLLVPRHRGRHAHASRGHVLFVCSLADMQGETWGLTAREHVEALMDHGMRGLVDYVLVHTPVPLRPDSPATDRVQRRHGRPARARLARRPFRREPVRAASGRCPSPITTSVAIQQQGPVVIARNLVDPQAPHLA